MQTIEAVSFKLEKAGLSVTIKPAGAGADSRFLVTYSSKGKAQKEIRATVEDARQRAEKVLKDLIEDAFPIEVKSGSVAARIYYTPTTNGYDAFTLSYYLDGKRKREQFGVLEEASRRGKKVVEDLSNGQVEVASLTLRDHDAYLHACKHLEGTGVSLESACKEYAEALRLLGGISILQVARDYVRRHRGTVTVKTVREVVDEFLAAKRAGRATRLRGKARIVSPKYLYELECKLNPFAERFQMPIGTVSAVEINKFIADLKVQGRTRNNYIQAIDVLFTFAMKENYLPRDHDVMDEVEPSAEADFAIEISRRRKLRSCSSTLTPNWCRC